MAEPNAFAITAAVAAFTKGEPWLEELRKYLWENRKTVCDFVAENLPQIHVVDADATYLMWLDCSAFTDDSVAFTQMIREKTGLYLSEGTEFGGNGRYFVRLNIACPGAVLMDGLQRLKELSFKLNMYIFKINKTGDRPVLSDIIKHLWHTRFRNISCIRLFSDSIVSIH